MRSFELTPAVVGAGLREPLQQVPVCPKLVALMRRDDGRPGPHRQRGEKPVVHGLEVFRASTTIDHLLSVCMGRVLGRFASSVEAPRHEAGFTRILAPPANDRV